MEDYVAGSSFSTRAMSSFPLSIGTALAFESIFTPIQTPYDPQRVLPEKINIFNYQEIYINLTTLIRNILGSVNKDVFMNADEGTIKDVLEQEIDVINSLFNNEGNGLCRPVYYYDNYKLLHLYTLRKNIKFREDKTDYQKLYRYKVDKILQLLFKDTDEHYEYNSEIKPKHKTNSLIITHIPFDLVSYTNFSKLDLLETHTGKLKERFQWNSKYYPVGDLSLNHLPFHKKLLYIFGDKVLLQPNDIKLRKLIVDISVKRNWTPITTLDKIIMDLELDVKELYVLKYIKEL